MIRHVAMFTWKREAAPAAIQSLASGLDAMPDHVPGILRYDHGEDLSLGSGTADYALVADFATVEDYRTYVTHPHHVAFLESVVRPIVASVSRVQHHLPDGDPG